MNDKRQLFLLGLLCVALFTNASFAAESVSIIPQPKSVETTSERFVLRRGTRLSFTDDAKIERTAHALADKLNDAGAKIKFERAGKQSAKSGIVLQLLPDTTMPEGSYLLTVDAKRVLIHASTPAGIFYGVQTLYQLLPPEVVAGKPVNAKSLTIPGVRIEDEPRFQWRGYLLDVSRHFQSKDFVKKLLDWMAFHKLNVFQWHLTDDQGWRVEIKKYPKLTEVGAWRDEPEYPGRRYGGFYSQQDIREVVKYAADRYITIVPEIEMPGHAGAALASYPQLSCSSEPTTVAAFYHYPPDKEFGPPSGPDVMCVCRESLYPFLSDVLKEVMDLFPGPYLHFGGDEVDPTVWAASPECADVMRRENMTNAAQLQSPFSARMANHISSQGRRVVGWDEILQGNPPKSTVIMAWRQPEFGIAGAKAGYDVVMTPEDFLYFDHAQSDDPKHPIAFSDDITPVSQVYSYEPVPAGLDAQLATHIIGVQANLWTELAYSSERLELLTFPRMSALAEVAWSSAHSRNWEDFQRRMTVQLRRYDALGIGYYKEIPRPRVLHEQVVFIGNMQLTVPAPTPDMRVHYTLDGSEPTAQSPTVGGPLSFNDDVVLKLRTVTSAGDMSSVTTVTLDRQEPRKGETLPGLLPGIHYIYVEKNLATAKELTDNCIPTREGTLPTFQIPDGSRPTDFGVGFEGYLRVDNEGVYTFYTKSDDGSLLYIGDQLMVNNDGDHGSVDRSGSIALGAGYHPIRVLYVQHGGGSALEVSMEGPGTAKQTLPPEVLYHNAGK